jgi:hypothetical protein
MAAAAVGCLVSTSVPPARAGVSTAAWMTASVFCRGLAAGLSVKEAIRVAWSDNLLLWSNEMGDPTFNQFLVSEALKQCPDLMRRNAPPQ